MTERYPGIRNEQGHFVCSCPKCRSRKDERPEKHERKPCGTAGCDQHSGHLGKCQGSTRGRRG